MAKKGNKGKWNMEPQKSSAAQMENGSGGTSVQVKAGCLSIVQPAAAQLGDDMRDLPEIPPFLALITFTNHTEILNRCRRMEERVFYILYSRRERFNKMELRRAIINQSYESVMSKEKKVTKALRG